MYGCVGGHSCHPFPVLKRKKIQFVTTYGLHGHGLSPAIFGKILMQASAETECTLLFCQEVLLSGVDNASGQYLDYATLKVCLIHYYVFSFRCCGSHINVKNLMCVFVFPVETTVEDRQPIVSQETEQPSVPVHTGNFIYYTFPPFYCTQLYMNFPIRFSLIFPYYFSLASFICLLRPAVPSSKSSTANFFGHQ